MRVATSSAYDGAMKTLQDRQRELSELQQKLTSGKRVERASDDPAAAARAERALASMNNIETDQRALDASNNAMTLTEAALGNAGDLLQQAREAILASGNATYSDSERKAQAQTLQQLRSQLLTIANRTDGAGTYLFGGLSPDQPPFDAAGQPTAQEGRLASASPDMPLTVNGRTAFGNVMSGNGVFETAAAGNVDPLQPVGNAWIDSGRVDNPRLYTGVPYTLSFAVAADGSTTYSVTGADGSVPVSGQSYKPGQTVQLAAAGISFTMSGQPNNGDQFRIEPSKPDLNVFQVLDRAIADLNTTGLSAGQRAQVVQRSLRDIDASAGSLQSLRSDVGQLMKRVDLATDRNQQTTVFAQNEKSAAEDLDMIAAYSEFTAKQTGYDAALKAYASVQKLSLFQYI